MLGSSLHRVHELARWTSPRAGPPVSLSEPDNGSESLENGELPMSGLPGAACLRSLPPPLATPSQLRTLRV